MDDAIDYKALALEAVEGLPPNHQRIAHYRRFEGSPIRLVSEISRLPQVHTAALKSTRKSDFFVTIETNSTNC